MCIFNDSNFQQKVFNLKIKRIAARKGVLVYRLEKSAISINDIFQKINEKFSKYQLTNYFIWLCGDNCYIYYSCFNKIDVTKIEFFTLYDTLPTSIYTLDRNFAENAIASLLSDLNKFILDNKQGAIFFHQNSLNLAKSLGFNELINVSNFPLIKPEIVSSISLNLENKNPVVGALFSSVTSFSQLLARYDISLNSDMNHLDSASATKLSMGDFILIQFHKFYSRFNAVEKILLDNNKTLEKKQESIEKLGSIEKVASHSLKYTLAQSHQTIVKFLDSVLGSAVSFKNLMHPYLMHNIYTHIAYESTEYFYRPEFELKDKLMSFKKDSKAFAKEYAFPYHENVFNFETALLLYYFFQVFDFIKCSVGMLFTHLVMQELSNLQDHFLGDNLDEKKTPFAVVPFQQKIISKFRSCFKQSLMVSIVDKNDFLIKLKDHLEDCRQSLINNLEKEEPHLRVHLDKAFGIVFLDEKNKGALTLGNETFESLIYDEKFQIELGNVLFTCLETINICRLELANKYSKKHGSMIKTYYYTFSPVLLEFLLNNNKTWLQTDNWPLIAKPNDWELKDCCIYVDEENTHKKKFFSELTDLNLKDNVTPVFYKDIVLGGYFYNKSIGSGNIKTGNSAIKIISLASFANISSNTVNVVNHLQTTNFSIDLIFMDYVEKNFIKCLLNYIEYNSQSKEIKHMFVLKDKIFSVLDSITVDYDECKFLEILPLEIFLNSSPTVIPLKSLDLDRNNALNKEKARLLRLYIDVLNNVMSFFDIFFTVKLFSPFNIYFSYFLDFRGRVYYDSRFLSFQGRNFSRAFLNIAGFDSMKDITVDSKIYSDFQLSVFKAEMEKSSRESFLYLKHFQNNICSLFSLDVTASGFQILAALTGNLELLLKTNFIVRKNETLSEKIDFYEVVLQSFLLKFDFCMNKSNLVSNISYFRKNFKRLIKLKKKKLLEYEVESKIFEFLVGMSLNIINSLKTHLNRKVVKNLLMPFIYSQGPKASIKNLKLWAIDVIFINVLHLDLIAFYDQFSVAKGMRVSIHQILDYVCELMRNGILSVLKDEFPGIFYFKDFIEEKFFADDAFICDVKKGILLKTSIDPESTYSFFSIVKKETFQYYKYSNFFKKKVAVSYTIYPTTLKIAEFDVSKAKHCIMPNLIHFLDAETLVETVLTLRLQNIHVAVAHDCLYCLPRHLNIVKEAYFNAVIKVLFKKDAFEAFLLANRDCGILTPLDLKLVDIFKKNRAIILEKIKSNEFRMSDFILTP